MLINDGTGKGYKAKVNEDNRLSVESVILSTLQNKAEIEGMAFSWSNISYDYDALDTILLVKNISDVYNLHITKVIFAGDATTEIVVHSPICAVPTGTAVVGTSLNRNMNKIASATSIADETTNTQANVILRARMLANVQFMIDLEGAVILGRDQCIAVDFTDAGTACNVTIFGYFKPYP